jgi:hypothetical protein
LPYFELESFFEKTSSILKKGGHFYFLSDYWWGQCNSTGLVGGIPWGLQRLSREDFCSHILAQDPSFDVNVIHSRLNYYHRGVQRPLLEDYISIANRYDLRLIAFKRHYGVINDGERIFFDQHALQKLNIVNEALEDIRTFEDRVTAQDLKTSFVSFLFEKK